MTRSPMALTHRDYDLIVVGGGIVGLAVAAALAPTPVQVAVVERHPLARRPTSDPRRVSALTAGSERILEGIGALEGLPPDQVEAIRSMVIWDGEGAGSLTFGACDAGLERLGVLAPNGQIAFALQEIARSADNVDWYCPATWKDLTRGEAAAECSVTLEAASYRLRAPLLVAADGQGSPVREAIGIPTVGWDYSQSAVVAEIHPRRPHWGRAFQRFLRGGPLALLPLSGGRCSLVWTLPRPRAEALVELDEATFANCLNRAFGPELGRLEVAGAQGSFPLRLRHARTYVRNRVALVGDAAHAIHPLAGLGLNLGLRDAAVLAETVAEGHLAGEDLGTDRIMGRYQRRRMPDNLLVTGYTDGLHRLFGGGPRSFRGARTLGINLLDWSGPLKRVLMRQGMGMLTDSGRLGCGEALAGPQEPKD